MDILWSVSTILNPWKIWNTSSSKPNFAIESSSCGRSWRRSFPNCRGRSRTQPNSKDAQRSMFPASFPAWFPPCSLFGHYEFRLTMFHRQQRLIWPLCELHKLTGKRTTKRRTSRTRAKRRRKSPRSAWSVASAVRGGNVDKDENQSENCETLGVRVSTVSRPDTAWHHPGVTRAGGTAGPVQSEQSCRHFFEKAERGSR